MPGAEVPTPPELVLFYNLTHILSAIQRVDGLSQRRQHRMTSSQEFRKFGTAMINYVADYLDNIRDRPVVPEVIKHFIMSPKLQIVVTNWMKLCFLKKFPNEMF